MGAPTSRLGWGADSGPLASTGRSRTGRRPLANTVTPTLQHVRTALQGRAPARLSAPLPESAAVALVLRPGAASLDLLLIRRAEHPGDPWSGHVAFPGGRADPGDADLVATAVREAREEVGLDLASAEHLGALDELEAIGRMRAVGLSIAPHVFALAAGDAPLSLSGEVESAHWVPLTRLADPAARSTYLHEHEGLRYAFPCIRAAGLVVWGLTHHMLTRFLALL